MCEWEKRLQSYGVQSDRKHRRFWACLLLSIRTQPLLLLQALERCLLSLKGKGVVKVTLRRREKAKSSVGWGRVERCRARGKTRTWRPTDLLELSDDVLDIEKLNGWAAALLWDLKRTGCKPADTLKIAGAFARFGRHNSAAASLIHTWNIPICSKFSALPITRI